MHTLIEEIYSSKKVHGQSGAVHALDSAISAEEGQLIYSLIQADPTVSKTLEVGCAFGLSSLHICQALQGRSGAHHIIVDPFQHEHWDGVGVANLDRSCIDFYKLVEERSEIALPRLCQEGEERFDFVFVDGFHTFDHTLLDCFFATRLLRTGGYLVIDDASWRSVGRCVRYLANYPCYKVYRTIDRVKPSTAMRRVAKLVRRLLPRQAMQKILKPSLFERIWEDSVVLMVALKKVSRDERNWKWYSEF